MKIYLILFLFLTFICNISFGQITHSISVGPELGILSKIAGRSSSYAGPGGSVEYRVKFNAPVAAQLHIGYNHFKDQLGGMVNFLPVRAGLVGFIYKDLIFVNADVGISHYHGVTTNTNQNGLSFGVGAGYKQPLTNNQFIQFSAYFNSHNYKDPAFGQDYNYNWFNFRVAYGLSFKRHNIPKEK